ncbi:ribonuclease J [Acuticoccus sp. MNP-M23]|uniref:ribonuclease J n=1 Tax=Acuticoccus sp. MNP-M23 TaxID=3072793 RepID=UPI0028157CFF|nr:ribonuclease J [Acuticoccus sp. MNP-M23]WMS42324.1 ribonuclease J [Acuticoccus sp. MNP-M23]
MNLGLYGFGPPHAKKWIIVDVGVTFGDLRTTPGVDLIMPDTAFIEEEKDNLLGIIITHAHEDHYGALLDLWPRLEVPVYATRFTAGLLKAKASENGRHNYPDVRVVEQGATIDLDPFKVELVAVSHSIPEPNALAITTPLGTIVHTGDWKIDKRPGVGKAIDIERLREIGDAGVVAMMCDSTNANREGHSPSEHEVCEGLKTWVASAKNRVAVTAFSSNVSRLKSIMEAAAAADRHVVVMGRAMRRVISVAAECGFLDGVPAPLSEDDFGHLPREKVLLLLTGSQGEERAALARIASDEHPRVAMSSGDRVIFSSRTIPGNEKSVNNVINGLALQGVEVVTDRDGLVHTSGHPRRDELKEMYKLVRPKVLVPVHGEPAHLVAQAKLAKAEGISEVVLTQNGKMVRLAPGPARVIDEVLSDVLLLDGRLLRTPEESNVRERRTLAVAGIISAMVTLDERFELDSDPEVVLVGIPEKDDEGELFSEALADAVENAVESIPRNRRRDRDVVGQAARRAIRSHMGQRWGKKPMCHVFVSIIT